jgi:hypothetical protein
LPKRDEVRGNGEKLHNEELNDLYSSPNTFWVIKSRRIRWVGHVARMGDRRVVYRVLVGNIKESYHLEDSGLNGKIILKWIFRKWDVGVWTGSNRLKIGKGGGRL